MLRPAFATMLWLLQVRRFVKFNLGEGLEKKSNDFAAEVAQQTQAKKADKPAADKPADKEQPKQQVGVGVEEVDRGLAAGAPLWQERLFGCSNVQGG